MALSYTQQLSYSRAPVLCCDCRPAIDAPAAKRSTDTFSASSSAVSSSDELVVLDPMGYYSMLGLTPSSQVRRETACVLRGQQVHTNASVFRGCQQLMGCKACSTMPTHACAARAGVSLDTKWHAGVVGFL